jgi:hypothetical protein
MPLIHLNTRSLSFRLTAKYCPLIIILKDQRLFYVPENFAIRRCMGGIRPVPNAL